MPKDNYILDTQPIKIQDFALMLLLALCLNALCQFSFEHHSSFFSKEEKELTENIEKEASRKKVFKSLSFKKTGGGEPDDDAEKLVAHTPQINLLVFKSSKHIGSLLITSRLSIQTKVYILFHQLIFYHILS